MIEVLPLTPGQLQLWKSQAISPDSPLFNQAVTLLLDKSFSACEDTGSRMQAAWQRVLTVHPALNTVITEDPSSGLARQEHAKVQAVLSVLDIRTEQINNWVAAQTARPLELSDSLSQVTLLCTAGRPILLYVNLHHLIADAWTTQLVCHALLAEFREPGSSVAENASFKNYIDSFNKDTNRASTSKQGPAGTVVQRPVFYGQPAGDPVTGSARHILPVSPEQLQQLASLKDDVKLQQLNRNLFDFTVHLTALVIYLQRVTGDSSIIIDVPLLGRFDRQWMNTAGNFIELVRLHFKVNPDQSVLEVYQHCRSQLYTRLKTAGPGCSDQLVPGPVHGVLNLITAKQAIQGAELRWHHTGHSDTHHPLRLHVADWNATGTPQLEIDLNQAFFNDAHSARALRHLSAVYAAIIKNRDTPINTIELRQPDELWRFEGSTVQAVQPFKSLPSAIVSCLDAKPEGIAIGDTSKQLSNRQLQNLSGNVCDNLRAAGIGKGDRVAVHLPRGLYLPAVLLGVLRSGAAYVPVDCEQPELRVTDILQDAQVACTITTTLGVHAGVTEFSPDAILSPADNSFKAPTPEPDAKDAAYIIYTSGSTGKPKGVVVSHGSVMAYLTWARSYYDLGEPLVMPLFSSIGFDLTVTSLYLPLLTNGCVRVFEQKTGDHPAHSGGAELFDVIRDKQINTVKLTPAHLLLLAGESLAGSSIRQLIVGGEDLKANLAAQISARFANSLKIVNEYGPTEATVGCIVRQWQEKGQDSNSQQGSVPIGLPINNMTAFILDNTLQPQLEGVPGALYLSGDSLAEGYWNAPELTAKTFIDNPWRPGSRLYHTGDLVRAVDNELVYLGREDGQLKINGYRVELGDIEAAVESHPAVTQCVALASVVDTDVNDEKTAQFCTGCGLDSRHPDARLDENLMCAICNHYKPNRSRVDAYFRSIEELESLIDEIKSRQHPIDGRPTSHGYDAIVLLSGGKDSTYSLCRLVDLGLRVYAFSLDNGYLSQQAKNNIETVCQSLGVDHHYASTPAMNEIFVDSLDRYSNVCNGCFKTIYTLALDFAAKHDIHTIFTGLSRGQLFETRLSNELFAEPSVSVDTIDEMVQAARVQYHAIDDGANRLLNIQSVNDGTLVNQVAIVDFYRYCHVEMSDMLDYIKVRAGWVRPPDTGRSTNCLINDAGIHVHKLERGFHNYSLPYSWDVRLGHKQRAEALEELDDDINKENVDTILASIGYTPKVTTHERTTIKVCYTTSGVLETSDLGDWVRQRLPGYMQPQEFAPLENMPVNAHGKIDRKQLSLQSVVRRSRKSGVPLKTNTEKQLGDIWKQHIAENEVHADDNFFALGGDSLSAIRCVMQLRRMGYSVQPADLFHHPRLNEFAELLQRTTDRSAPDQQPMKDPVVASTPEKFASLGAAQREKLQQLLQARKT